MWPVVRSLIRNPWRWVITALFLGWIGWVQMFQPSVEESETLVANAPLTKSIPPMAEGEPAKNESSALTDPTSSIAPVRRFQSTPLPINRENNMETIRRDLYSAAPATRVAALDGIVASAPDFYTDATLVARIRELIEDSDLDVSSLAQMVLRELEQQSELEENLPATGEWTNQPSMSTDSSWDSASVLINAPASGVVSFSTSPEADPLEKLAQQAANEANPETRGAALVEAISLREARVVEVLGASLRDPEPSNRLSAVEGLRTATLEGWGDKSQVDLLLTPLLSDVDATVADAARTALTEIENPN